MLTGAERLRDQRPHRIRGFLSTLERLQHGDQLIEQRRDLAEGQAGFAADTGFLAAVSWARYRKPQHTYNAVGDVRMRPLSKMSQRNANVKDHETPRKIFGRLLAL